MSVTGYTRAGITRDGQAKAMVRNMADLAQELIDGAQIAAAADRMQTAADELRAYAKARGLGKPLMGAR